MTHSPIALRGAPGSPYTRKMLAMLRYRQIPYRFLVSTAASADLPRPKVELLPTFYLPDAQGELEAVVDSTPLIRRLEALAPDRRVIPTDPALKFLDELLEDYGDEWLTKAMFHYRWAYRDDIDQAAAILPRWRGITASDESMGAAAKMFADRQINRLYVVGSNPVTGPVIEASYVRFLEAFNAHLTRHPFLMGARPGASDFAVYGQLTQLTHFDPTPSRLTLATAPRVYAWVDLVEDLSGLEPGDGDWISPGDLARSLRPLFEEVGRTYVPVMLANAAALSAGADKVETSVEGLPWTQQPFPYQGKCVQQLRRSYAALAGAERATVDAALEGTGCEALLAGI
jgi:glutathione S-transferase